MVGTVLGLISSVLSLWSAKEKNKYVDQHKKLEELYWAEINKPEGERNDAAIVDLEFDIKNLAQSLMQVVGNPTSESAH